MIARLVGVICSLCLLVTQSDPDIVQDQDPLKLSTFSPPAGWSPDLGLPLDSALPVAWPDKYLQDYEQNFNPWTFMTNASMLCWDARNRPDNEPLDRGLAARLLLRLYQYSERQGPSVFVVYRFSYTYRDFVLEHDWVSAFGQATVLIGLLQLELCWPGSTRFEEYAAAFEVTAGDGMWFSRHLSRGGVWFEEVALEERPTQIMNGHVYSMLALYYLWNETADDRWLVLFEQANLGLKRYVSEFRRPGETNCYDRIDPCFPDYGPERTVFLMDALFEITDEEAWRVMRDLFASDMGFDGSTFGSVQGPGS